MDPTTPGSPDTSSSTYNDITTVIENDVKRYNQKGSGLLGAIAIVFIFFFVLPAICYKLWPTYTDPHESRIFFLLFDWGTHSFFYIVANIAMYFIYTKKIPFFEKDRVYNKPWPWEENPQKWKMLFKDTMITTIIAHLVIFPALLVLDTKDGLVYRMDKESFPGVVEIATQIIVFMIVEDFGFYWSHRLIHSKYIYPYIHKKHHEYNISVSIACEYSHPLEWVFTGLIPSSMGSKLYGSRCHFVTLLLWNLLRITETIDGHCGYDFTWSPFRLLPLSGSARYHSFHHSHNQGNYSSFFTIWDTLCGTNKNYYKFIAKSEEQKQSPDKLKAKQN
jgi:sterol desaturase/sphingolipid hydroxylase (fatty acid hydroxylase superfamily)